MKISGKNITQLILLPVMGNVLFFVHGYALMLCLEVTMLPHARSFKLAGLLVNSVLGAVLTAGIFSYPLVKIYARYAVSAAVVICIPTVFIRTPYVFHTSGLPFVIATLALDIVALLIIVPYGTWLLRRMRSNQSFKADASGAA